jgi:hypothetical protein
MESAGCGGYSRPLGAPRARAARRARQIGASSITTFCPKNVQEGAVPVTQELMCTRDR